MIKEQTLGNASMEQGELQRRRKNIRKNDVSNFISKTFRILEDKDNQDTISWTDNGNSFIVKDKERFQSTILPKYFKHSKFSSFVRQLNMYDFHKLRKEKEIQVFRHKYFKMNKRQLLKKIKRKCLQQNVDNQDHGEEIEPNNNIRADDYDKGQQIQNHLQMVAKENQELYKDIDQYQGQILQCAQVKSVRKEKLLKIVNAFMYMGTDDSPQKAKCTLHTLVDHFKNREQAPFKFGEYKDLIRGITEGIQAQFSARF